MCINNKTDVKLVEKTEVVLKDSSLRRNDSVENQNVEENQVVNNDDDNIIIEKEEVNVKIPEIINEIEKLSPEKAKMESENNSKSPNENDEFVLKRPCQFSEFDKSPPKIPKLASPYDNMKDDEIEDRFTDDKPPVKQTVEKPRKSRKSSVNKVRKSEMRKSVVLGQINVFEELQQLIEMKDKTIESDWEMYSYDLDNKYAIFTWFERTVRVIVKLGEKLQPTRSRKSIGMCVTHYTIESINLGPTGPEIMQDAALDTAIHLLTARFPNQSIISKCPNTHSLRSLLNEISGMVVETLELYRTLKYIEDNWVTTIQNNIVSVDFASPVLQSSFSIQVDYTHGINTAISNIQLKPKPWNSYDLSSFKKQLPGLKDLTSVCSVLWKTMQQAEADCARLK
eukprot:TRINITY_DN13216_c0_g1_i6.p1 TRINITY_DN13216_c0_g1~~TRINITY_DN13216_c0_g1_i6.p1  ORF type:complete len:430 (-),score=94.91 TRINITY_DN13216_c0_g1_i6:324-1511(-)